MKLKRTFTAEMSELNQRFGSDFAIISHIEHNRYTVVEVASKLDIIAQGAEFKTEETYCNEVVNRNDLVTYNEVGSISAMVLHPIYTAMQLEAYIGEPLHSNGQVIGTLNFSGFAAKEPKFTEEEIQQVKNLAREIEQNIEI